MLETEAKFRVDSHGPVRERLRALGATFVSRVIETNYILDRPDGSLCRAARGLRVRTARDEAGSEKPATLTFKGPRRAGPLKSREELEVEISAADTTLTILNMLGFVEILTYEKLRESWSCGKCRVELDEPPHIGLFIEIEGPDVTAIRSLQSKLGLEGVRHTPLSYVGLLWEYCLEHDIADRVLRLPGETPLVCRHS